MKEMFDTNVTKTIPPLGNTTDQQTSTAVTKSGPKSFTLPSVDKLVRDIGVIINAMEIFTIIAGKLSLGRQTIARDNLTANCTMVVAFSTRRQAPVVPPT
jgi:hypothetical protein